MYAEEALVTNRCQQIQESTGYLEWINGHILTSLSQSNENIAQG